MNKIVFILVCLIAILVSYLPPMTAVPLARYYGDWKLVRTEAAEDAASLAACLALTTNGNYANMPTTAFCIPGNIYNSESSAFRIALAFCCGDAENETFSYVVYGWASSNGPAEFICSGTGTVGTQAVVKYPHNAATATNKYWADTLTLDSATTWLRGTAVADSGNNRVCKLWFDTTGIAFIKVYLFNANGTAPEANSITVYARFF